jgi:hypothetical protein
MWLSKVIEAPAFGSSATQSGQILDTTSDTAVAKAATETRTGDAGVRFSRQFELSGSPQGWNVSLSGQLNGSLGALGTSTGAHASVLAQATISPSLGIDLSRQVGFTPPFQDVPYTVLSLSQTHTALLSDGVYTVTGLLRTQNGSQGGVAGSDFFGLFLPTPPQPPFGFQVSVSASAVPEPSSVLLLATGLVGAAWAYRKRRG